MASQSTVPFQSLPASDWNQIPPTMINLKRRFPGDSSESAVQVVISQVSHSMQQAQRRKENHNATEQKRRQKINEKINELKELLPHCREQSLDKATILNEAIELIRKYIAEIESWRAREVELKRLNEELLHENDELARSAGLPSRKKQMIQEIQEIQESPLDDGKQETPSDDGK